MGPHAIICSFIEPKEGRSALTVSFETSVRPALTDCPGPRQWSSVCFVVKYICHAWCHRHGIYFYSTYLYESILFWNPSTSLSRLARVFRPDGGDVMQRPVQHGGGHQLDSQRQLCGQQDLLSAWPLQLPVEREQIWGEDSHVCGHCFWTLSV